MRSVKETANKLLLIPQNPAQAYPFSKHSLNLPAFFYWALVSPLLVGTQDWNYLVMCTQLSPPYFEPWMPGLCFIPFQKCPRHPCIALLNSKVRTAVVPTHGKCRKSTQNGVHSINAFHYDINLAIPPHPSLYGIALFYRPPSKHHSLKLSDFFRIFLPSSHSHPTGVDAPMTWWTCLPDWCLLTPQHPGGAQP